MALGAWQHVLLLGGAAALTSMPRAARMTRPRSTRPRAILRAETTDGADGPAAAATTEDVLGMLNEGIERHPTLVRSVAVRTKELLKDERELLDDESFTAKMERFFQGIVRHPAMLWGTFLRVAELMEEELLEAGDADSLKKADTIKQVRIAAEAVRESRQI